MSRHLSVQRESLPNPSCFAWDPSHGHRREGSPDSLMKLGAGARLRLAVHPVSGDSRRTGRASKRVVAWGEWSRTGRLLRVRVVEV